VLTVSGDKSSENVEKARLKAKLFLTEVAFFTLIIATIAKTLSCEGKTPNFFFNFALSKRI